jgi:hypothetical protein
MLNLTQHKATEEQVAQGIEDLPQEQVKILANLLTFEEVPTAEEMRIRAKEIASLARQTGATAAMIGGAPFFMSSLEAALQSAGIQPRYAFSKRESVDQPQPDGSVRKVAVFKHITTFPAAQLDTDAWASVVA